MMAVHHEEKKAKSMAKVMVPPHYKISSVHNEGGGVWVVKYTPPPNKIVTVRFQEGGSSWSGQVEDIPDEVSPKVKW